MREASPGPAAISHAVRSSIACTSRKSSFSAPGTCAAVQVAPPSVVIRYVPCAPLAHATRSLTAATPRRDAVVFDLCGVQVWADVIAATASSRPPLLRIQLRRILGRHHRRLNDVFLVRTEIRVMQHLVPDLDRLIDAE